jgi:hypothetical protein
MVKVGVKVKCYKYLGMKGVLFKMKVSLALLLGSHTLTINYASH